MELKLEYCNNYKALRNYNEVQEWIKSNYLIFNALFFDNMLPPAEMMIFEPIIKNVSYLGCAYNNDLRFPSKEYPFKIRINFVYDLNEIEWKNVLLHEMIHIWQYTNGYKGGHGKLFKKKAKEINEIGGWGITCTYKNILGQLKYARDKENDR